MKASGAMGDNRGMNTPIPPSEDDPEPIAPTPPEPYECCQSGCIPCIYDLYNDEMDRYREALKVWRERHGIKQ